MRYTFTRAEISAVTRYCALSVACPFCKRPPRKSCVSKKNTYIFHPHRSRASAYLLTQVHRIHETPDYATLV